MRETKEIKITVPEGYEIDKENSTFEKIVFKKKEEPKTYNEVADLTLRGKEGFYTDFNGAIIGLTRVRRSTYCPNTATSKEQLEWILALNKLQNVANYLNDGWKPDWAGNNHKCTLFYDAERRWINTAWNVNAVRGMVYFKTEELAKKAIKILGEEVIKTALGVYKGC